MTRLLALLLLAASPVWGQEASAGAPVAEAPAAESDASASSEAGAPGPAEPTVGAEEVPADPVAAWEADPTLVLPAEGVDLDAFEYLARPLVVFADSPRQPQVLEQLRLIEAEMEALVARDVVVILDTDPDARTAVRQALRPRGFGLVLMDKDGRVTLRRPAPLSVREIAHAIDRTPIRREEIRNAE